MQFKECYALEKIHGCVKKGTKIMLAGDNEVPIEDIKIGDIVITYDENTKKFVNNKVSDVLVRDADIRLPWMSIILQNNKEVVCTEDHPFLTQRGWIPARDLTISDEIIEYK